MTISWLQAVLLGLFACLSSMPGMGGSSIGNYTLGRPLIGGFVCGLILGDMQTGILVGCAMQVIYIALVTPGGTVSADVRAVSYIVPACNGCVKELRPYSNFCRRRSTCNIFRCHGWYTWNRIILRNSNDQPGLAAHGLESSRKQTV